MNVFATFKERAQASMRDAVSTATELASSAMENVKVISDTVAHDMKILAKDARQKAKALTDEVEEEPTGPRPRDVGINERLISVVQSLSYASFADRENGTNGTEDSEGVLEPWQVQHAQVILKECPELESLRFALCPKRMSELQFWSTYFLLVKDFLDQAGNSAEASGAPGRAESPELSVDGGKSATTPSALAGWEDVQGDETASAPSPNTVPAPADDLDQYLQEMLDGDGTGAHDHAGASEGGDLDEYLKELDEGGVDGADTNGDYADVDDYLGELNLTDDEAAKDEDLAGEQNVTDTPEKASAAASITTPGSNGV